LVTGFALASVGGPLALVVLLGPDAVGGPAIGASGLVAALGIAMFVPPLIVWWRFGERIASGGGLYTYVRLAAGPRIGLVHAGVWIVSYFLYLPSTVNEIVYDLLPVGFPGVVPYRGWLSALVPVAIVAAIVLVERAVMAAMGLGAVLQVVLVGAFVAVVANHAGLQASAFTAGDAGRQVPRGAANVGLFFVCASLPLYLGGEVRGGGRALRRIVVGVVAVTALCVLVGLAVYGALAGSAVATLPAPGYTLARVYAGNGFAQLLLAGAVVSVASVITAEYVALTRLVNAVAGVPVRRAALAVGALFVAADVASLVDPEHIYDHTLTASLVALYVSQIIVFLVYPLWRRALGRLSALDVAVAAAAAALMGFGLYVAVTQAGVS
jgi:amino acid transporter